MSSIAKAARTNGEWEVWGSIEAFNGILKDKPEIIRLTRRYTAGIHVKGGTIIGTTNKGNPISFPVLQPDGSHKLINRTDELISKIKNCSILFHFVGIGNQSIKTSFESVNYEFTKHILLLSKKANIKKIIYLSGLGVSQRSTSGYFISKFKAEQEIKKSNYTRFLIFLIFLLNLLYFF